jgi:hypothetical protein
MSTRKRLLADAISTAPWVADLKGVSTKTLAFIVYHGGGNCDVVRASEDRKVLGELGSKEVLRLMAENYGRAV